MKKPDFEPYKKVFVKLIINFRANLMSTEPGKKATGIRLHGTQGSIIVS